VVVVDTGAIRPEYGDAGLGPIFDFLRHRAPEATLCVRPSAGAEVLVTAEAGEGVTVLSADRSACVGGILAVIAT
jgi:hypothetical protein